MTETDVAVRVRSQGGTTAQIPWSTLPFVDLDDSVPFRNVRHVRGQVNHPGWLWCATAERHVQHESRLERWRLLLADFDPEIVDIREQPFQVVMRKADGRLGNHVPDFFFRRRTLGPLLVNVKPPDWEDRKSTREVTRLMGPLCAQLGWEYEIWTGGSSTVLANVQWLAGFRDARRCGATPEAVASVLAIAVDSPTLGDLEELAASAGVARPRAVAMHLLWTHRLTSDLDSVLDTDSPVAVAPGSNQ